MRVHIRLLLLLGLVLAVPGRARSGADHLVLQLRGLAAGG